MGWQLQEEVGLGEVSCRCMCVVVFKMAPYPNAHGTDPVESGNVMLQDNGESCYGVCGTLLRQCLSKCAGWDLVCTWRRWPLQGAGSAHPWQWYKGKIQRGDRSVQL